MASADGIMESLYGFGFNGCGQILQHDEAPSIIAAPMLMRNARQIKVLWASWCDVLIAMQNNDRDAWGVEYLGGGLTAAQKEHLELSADVKFALGNNVWNAHVGFFGAKMHHGLRGLVFHNITNCGENVVVIYATDREIDDGVPEIQTLCVDGDDAIVGIEMLSGNDLLVSIRTQGTNECSIKHFDSLASLQHHLVSKLPFTSDIQSAPRTLSGLLSNSTMATVPDCDRKVLTFTKDPRYPQSLGRPFGGSICFDYIPYLSETSIVTIASGGYMTAALSDTSELFLWGRSCPKSVGDLTVLKYTPPRLETVHGASSITAEEEQDEYVKCLTIRIDGEEAYASHVAVGHGHVLVAAISQGSRSPSKRTVFAAGDGSKGQLGIAPNEFAESFEEVETLAGVSISQLVAAGWTTWTVVQEG